jgi:putative ABC transport system permease protein
MDRSIEQQVASIKGVKKTSSQIYIQPLPYIVCCTVENMLIVGYDPETDFTIAPWVEYSLGRPPTKYEMIVGNGVKFYPAQIVYFYGQEFSVSATLDSTGLAFFDNGAFITMDAAYEMATKSPEEAVEPLNISPNQISSVLVQLASFADPEEVIEEIESSIPEVGVVSVREATLAVKRQLFGLLQSLFIIIGLLWAMVVLMIGSIFSMSVNERQREIGLLRAMGATKGFVFKQIVLEATLLTTAGGILGVICGGVIILAFKNLIVASLKVHYIWLPPLLTVLLITACLVLAVLTGVIAALYPATMSSKLEPYAAIRRGE